MSGEVTPETCVVEFGSPELDEATTGGGDALLPLRVVRRRLVLQERKYDVVPGGGVGVCETTAAEREAGGPLTPALLRRLAAAAFKVATAKGVPQDIEWCEAAGTLYIVQASGADCEGRVTCNSLKLRASATHTCPPCSDAPRHSLYLWQGLWLLESLPRVAPFHPRRNACRRCVEGLASPPLGRIYAGQRRRGGGARAADWVAGRCVVTAGAGSGKYWG